MGFNGPVALNLLAITQAMKDYSIPKEERIDFSLKVRKIAGIVISARADEAEAARKRNKK